MQVSLVLSSSSLKRLYSPISTSLPTNLSLYPQINHALPSRAMSKLLSPNNSPVQIFSSIQVLVGLLEFFSILSCDSCTGVSKLNPIQKNIRLTSSNLTIELFQLTPMRKLFNIHNFLFLTLLSVLCFRTLLIQ